MDTKLKFNLPREKSSLIKVIGVGGSGGNAVNHMFTQGIKGVDFLICNTDLQALEASPIPNKIQLGANLTQGLGAGANPEVGKRAAMETIEDIIDAIGVNTKMLFVTTGLGGGTGTGAAPIIAKTAKEMDILVVAIVTTPFSFEGKKRKDFAFEGLENIKKSVDCLLVINNDKIKEMYGNLPMRQAFAHANDILNTAAKGIAEIITHPGEINVDFEDVKTVMKSSGVALMGSAKVSGTERALIAVKDALSSPLLNDNKITGARNILLNVSSSSGEHELLMSEFEEISNYVQEQCGHTAEMIIGTSYDDSLDDNLSVTLIATGFETKPRENFIKMPGAKPLEQNNNPVDESKVVHVLSEIKPVETSSESKTDVEKYSSRIEEDEGFEADKNLFFETSDETNEEQFDHSEIKMDSQDSLKTFDNICETNEERSIAEKEQEINIEKQIARIKKLKDLNITLKNPQGLRDIEKEPAYKRKNKKLDNVPHSSSVQVSRLSLFDDSNGKSEIKTNNSFLHDNVD